MGRQRQRPDLMLHYARFLLGRSAPSVVVSLSPPTQDASGSTAAWTFGSCTVTVTGGTATNYAWGCTDDGSSGNWLVNSGQGTATAAPRVSVVGSFEQATCGFYCDVTVGGNVYRRTCSCSYTRTA